ncbi:putative membrane glycoprotein UL7 [Cynomolgus macaque cytomegalovirus strain Ottawa]|uniref:Membrane glycoprotein UL7 n=1 Tax=macacine betaherpesvirus 8 TaxID=2560567 RepID=G8H117_9BETA|nr:putative membrane glycoprotein UL7 [Cynomolgus macaque cytomegalovirus strain Ottawa]AEQ32091.1 putative membrane glycoprotein UL7 [Cynomolgus macaque cytomegalovirus strain Ottawa]
MQIPRLVYASLAVFWAAAVIHGQTSDSSSKATTTLWANKTSTSQPTTIQLTTEPTSGYRNGSHRNGTAAPPWTTIADDNTTTLPPWPIEIQSTYFSLWVNGCYCGSLSVLPGVNVTLNSTKKQNNTETLWFRLGFWTELLCIFYFENDNDSMKYDHLTFTCTQNNITLWNVSEKYSGIYCERQMSLTTYNSTYICYNLTVTADATNATEPSIVTTKCYRSREYYSDDDTSVEISTTSDSALNIDDILNSRRNFRDSSQSNLLGYVLQFGWLGVIVIGSTITLALVFRVPQKFCYLFYRWKNTHRGYEKIPGQIL